MGGSLTALSDDGMLFALSSAASGMRAAAMRLDTSARKIAHVSASGAVPVGRLTGPASPGPNLEDAILEQAIAKNDFVANARTFEAAQAMVKQLFDLSD